MRSECSECVHVLCLHFHECECLSSARLTHRHHVVVLTATGAAEGAGRARRDGRVGLPRVVNYL